MHESRTRSVVVTPVLTTTAYTSGDVLGTGNPYALPEAILRNGLGGVIVDVCVADNAGQSLAIDIFLFRSIPTGGTLTDNAAVAIAAADNFKCIGVISIAATDYTTLSSGISNARKEVMLGFNLKPAVTAPSSLGPATGSLYAVFVTRGAPTYAVGSLQFTFSILQDT